MSNQDLARDAFYEENGRRKHRDQYGIWDINEKGWENLFYNQIVDEDFRDTVEAIIDNNDGSTNTTFDFGTEKFTIWFKSDKKNTGISRRLQLAKNTQTFDTMDQTPKQAKQGAGNNLGIPDSIKKIMDSTAAQNKDTGGFKAKGPSGYFDPDSVEFGELTQFKLERQQDKSLRLLTPKEISPTNYMISNGHDNIPYVYWGKWVKYT